LLPMRLFLGTVLILSYFFISTPLCLVDTIFSGRKNIIDSQKTVIFRFLVEWGRLWTKLGLVVMGFYRIRKFGKREKASTIVSNHVSYLDVLILWAETTPSFVSKESVLDIPLFGRLAKYFGGIFIEGHERDQRTKKRPPRRRSLVGKNRQEETNVIQGRKEHKKGRGGREKKQSGIAQIIKRQKLYEDKPSDLLPLLVFPEGTTTNGRFLIHFHKGAFSGGYPVQPVLLRFNYQHFSPTWESIPFFVHGFLLLTQMYNSVEIIYLPTYFPKFEEISNPQLYAKNVQERMAEALGVIACDQTVKDKVLHHRNINYGILRWYSDPFFKQHQHSHELHQHSDTD